MSAKFIIFFSVLTCIRCLKEPSHLDGSFEYPQQVLNENFFLFLHYALLTGYELC